MTPGSEPLPPGFVSPDTLLEELGIESSADIQIEAIAQHCGATVVYEPLEGSDGRLLGFGDQAFITVDSRASLPRRRFSAAHELGHWMWDRGKTPLQCGGDRLLAPLTRGERNPERRANSYAADLLLPKSLFLPAKRGRPPSLRAIQELAASFSTSLVATALRWVEVESAPVFLASYGREGLMWSARSPNVPPRLQLLGRPDPLSAAAQLLGSDRESVEAVPLQESFWLEQPTAPYSIHEESTRLTPDLVLSLLMLDPV